MNIYVREKHDKNNVTYIYVYLIFYQTIFLILYNAL